MDSLDIALVIQAAKLGRTRKDAQEDTCSVFAAALYDFLSSRGVPCKMVTAVKNGHGAWAHAVVEVDGRLYDSFGEFSTEIYRARAKIHPSVTVNITYKPDVREECYEPEFEEMYAFYLKMLTKAANAAAGPASVKAEPRVKKPKLSKAQEKVMLWLSQGWGARVSHGAAVEINGERVCNVDTMTALEKMGLVSRDPSTRYWKATDEGKKLSPSYREPESLEVDA
ncbi:TPA: hypothetical protein ACGW3N_000251 [Pseudomonas aeruginosa]|uniref:hypothetical protein n=1 Tax=Pseudomonas TaxID=286 RepID=UPI00159EC683|nr:MULTISPECIES: hypothetical protein [Pseudomonas]ELG7182267.1 hypothetical protein [Pseudomonas aeruginosa]MBI6603217.1 hypothetical protein [Pseudomonas sp. S4_EA_1b]MBI8852354.1 hypothetical protein [Pseudomonas aeruginosa]HCF9659947.1 hypothetical protein [Pseudomonas aeruginosa]